MRHFHLYLIINTNIFSNVYQLQRIIQKFIILLQMNTTTDKKRTNGTIDRTSPFTGAGLEFNTTFQRKSSDSRSTASNLSMTNSFQISAQSLMPILLKIKDENQRFGSQKDQICKQMKTLENLTQNLLTENQALRFHYKQRSNDVKQLIQSMTVNFNEDLNETKHLVHSYREHNCMLAKQIEQINTKMSSHQQIINKVAQQLYKTTSSNSKLEDNLRNRQVKNKLTNKNMQKLEKVRDSKKIDELEKDICDLQIDINLMKKKNIFTLNYIRGEKNSISAQKPEIKDRAIQAIKSGKKLKQEVEVIQSDYKKYCHQKSQLELKVENLNKKYQTLYANAQSKRNKLNRLTEKKAKTDEDCAKLKCTNEILSKEKEKREQERSKLQKQIKRKKQQISNAAYEYQKKKNNIINQTSKKIGNSKDQIRKLEGNMNKTIFKQLNPQKIQFENILLSLKKELSYLENQSNELKQKVSSMPNPMRDILRMQMQLKKLKLSKR